MLVIGERINGMFRDVRRAIQSRDKEVIQDLARRQVEAGAQALDINVGTASAEPVEAMVWLVEAAQEAVSARLCIDSAKREVFEPALEAYKGTLCFITHDRTLIRETANKIIEITDGQLHIYPGNYDDYLYRKESPSQVTPEKIRVVKAGTPVAGLTAKQRRYRKMVEGELRNQHYREMEPVRNRLANIESEIARFKTRMQEIETLLADPGHYKDSQKVVAINREYKDIKDNIDSLNEEHGGLSAKTERLKLEHEKRLKNL